MYMSQVKTNYGALLLLALVPAFCVVLISRSSTEQLVYDTSKPVASVQVDDATVSIPSWSLFHDGQMWSLVSSSHQLELTFAPELTDTTVAHAPDATKISTRIHGPLTSMIAQAKTEGVNLMLSSAYRSALDQQVLYSALLTLHGREYVQQYVAAPGASEHQTGLAVDIATVTHGCEIDANACSLDANGIAWLRTHAAEYGFIERYPSGKQSITGVAGEHWHYRYVGVPLAKALISANMTLDEFVQQIAPGYAK